MLIQSLEAYVEKDLDKAQKVIAHDDVIDDLFEEVKQELIELIRNHADEGEQAVDLLMKTGFVTWSHRCSFFVYLEIFDSACRKKK